MVEYLTTRLNIDTSDIEVCDMKSGISQSLIHLKPFHPGMPSLIVVNHEEYFDFRRFIPYHRVNERPDRQIISYTIGKGLSNLAEINEVGGELYSRSCLSYDPCELIHQDPVQSCMGLWVHDCLTEDLDHHTSLNRKVLPDGACISFDFGLAFSCRYYPPFYTAELGLLDEEIEKQQAFLIDLLSDYAERLTIKEHEMMASVRKKYPETHHASLCRYYFENFKSLFSVRLRYGRFFEKIKKTEFDPGKLRRIADTIELKIHGVRSWEQLIAKLAAIKPVPMDLRGLDLSGVDLRNAYFKDADLREVNLSGSNVDGADFRGADLRGACLDGTNMEKATTEGAVY